MNRYFKYVVLPFFLIIYISQSQAQDTIYVNNKANGKFNGNNWEDAYGVLQTALTKSSEGDVIWIATGTYYPTQDTFRNEHPYSNQQKTFLINKDIKIYGGFQVNDTSLNEHIVKERLTILSGDLEKNDKTNPASSYLDIVGQNAHHVLIVRCVTSNCVLNGLTITAGQATINNGEGGGILNDGKRKSSTPIISNCAFLGNMAIYGGGLCNSGLLGKSSAILSHCDFIGNFAMISGGGLTCKGAGGENGLQLNDCTFQANKAKNKGAGLYINSNHRGKSITSIERCYFVNNNSDYGAAIFVESNLLGDAQITIGQSDVEGNHAVQYGGAIYCMGACVLKISDSVIQKNSSENYVGGLYFGASDEKLLIEIDKCKIHDNSALFGGALMCCSGNGKIDLLCSNTSFENNKSTKGKGSVIRNICGNNSGEVILNNCYLRGNQSAMGNIPFYNLICGVQIKNSTVDCKSCEALGELTNCGTNMIFK